MREIWLWLQNTNTNPRQEVDGLHVVVFTLLPIELALFSASFGFTSTFFLHFIQSITLVSRWRHPRIHRGKISGSQPAKAEITRERTLPSISRKNKTKGSCDAKKKHIRINGRFSNIQEKNYQSKIVFQVVLSGMPRNNVYKKEWCNYTLGFKETWKCRVKTNRRSLSWTIRRL